MKTAFLILISFTTLLSCAKKSMNFETSAQTTDTIATTPNIPAKGPFQYLALGDSYTIGQSVSQSESFPYQLKTLLKTQNYIIADPQIIATTGWTTGDLKNAIVQANITQKYDIVTLLIGVNNQYRGYNQNNYRTEFIQLLNTAIGFANNNPKRVFVLSIPDYGVTPFASGSDRTKIATEIDQYNAINYAESTNAGVNYINITDISRQYTDASYIAVDGLHPSAKSYALWVQRLAPAVIAQLSK